MRKSVTKVDSGTLKEALKNQVPEKHRTETSKEGSQRGSGLREHRVFVPLSRGMTLGSQNNSENLKHGSSRQINQNGVGKTVEANNYSSKETTGVNVPQIMHKSQRNMIDSNSEAIKNPQKEYQIDQNVAKSVERGL